ncbi:MAG: hypothetical protein D6815_00820 [Candidatus Dadabacteria bacterium]|nr:MAG: hypothetical protein D6815_00820 [Candidatus Dadabacteria bacterium]
MAASPARQGAASGPEPKRRRHGRTRPLAAASVVATCLLLAGCTILVSSPWHSRYGRNHPLAGRFWDSTHKRFTDWNSVVDAAASATYLLVGETHENRDHHELQARLFGAVVARGRRPALSMEMLDTGQHEAIERCLAEPRCDAAHFRRAVSWDTSGWPSWSWYAPIIEIALRNGLPIVPANLPRSQLRKIARQGKLETDLAARLWTAEAIPPAVRREIEEDIRVSHCHQVPERLVASMALAQRVRDAFMAETLAKHAAGGVVFVAGNGHVRADRGVPLHLRLRNPNARIVTVGALEVRDGLRTPPEYAQLLRSTALPFDYVWFSPRASNRDPCEEFRKQLEQIGGHNRRTP